MPSMVPPTSTAAAIVPIQPFRPDLHERAWASIPHPTLPLIATAHAKAVTVFSLSTLSSHSTLTGGHTRSVRTAAWKPNLPPHKLCLVSGSFDATAGLWRWDGDGDYSRAAPDPAAVETTTTTTTTTDALETEIPANTNTNLNSTSEGAGDYDSDAASQATDENRDWEFTLVLEGHDSEIKCCAFAPSGAYLATCSRDKSVWIWEDIGASEADDEWETIAVLNEHEGDVKAVAWCPDVPGRNALRRQYGSDVLASASYDNTVRIWREDGDGEWVCVAVLEGHEGTVWAVEWEPRPRNDRFPRLLSCSADGTIRMWELQQEGEEDGDGDEAGSGGGAGQGPLGGIPNTMRTSLRDEWTCISALPAAHDRDVYSVSWSKETGLVASTGRDGKIALYREDDGGSDASKSAAGAGDEVGTAEPRDQVMSNANGTNGQPAASSSSSSSKTWNLLKTMPNAHGPFEVNHITWCRRYDAAAERRGEEEMLVTTGDDGVVRSWQVKIDNGKGVDAGQIT